MIIYILSSLYINGHEVDEKSVYKIESGSRYHIIKIIGPVYQRYKDELTKEGIKIYDYLSGNGFIVKAEYKQIERIKNRSYIGGIYPIKSEYKLPRDYREKLNTCYVVKDGKYKVRILYYDEEDREEILRYIRERNVDIDYEDKEIKYIQAYVDLGDIGNLIKLEGVKFIEFQYPIVNWNNRNRILHQAGIFADNPMSIDDTIVWKKEIRGEGQILGHYDDGFDKNHCFFNGTVDGQNKQVWVWYYQGGNNNPPAGSNCNTNPGVGCHGTHTAGTAVGGTDGQNQNLSHRGIAPKARIVSQANCCASGAPSLSTVLSDAYQRGARVHTNSWGYVCWGCSPTDYNTDARTIDQFIWNNNDMVVVFAAGNQGDDNCVSGCYRTASDPASAKNDITVGAMTRTLDAKWGWSAYGNYPSGRYSVDIMAMGGTTYSASGGTACGITTASWWMGTSMATPVVAGASLLVRQYYFEGWYGNGTKNSAPSINPSSALVKASILASAVPISRDGDVAQGNENNAPNNPVPNGNEGAGRLVLDNVMYFTPEDNWQTQADSSNIRKSRIYFVDNSNGISTNQTHTYTISLCRNMLTRIVLAWSDYPANVNCNTTTTGCLVNNLNLRLEKGSDYWNGNARPTAPTSNDIDTTRRNVNIVDTVNNWEIVRILPPKDTIYTIKIIGQNVPNGPQRYALVVSGGMGCEITPVSNGEAIGDRTYKRVGNNLVFNSKEPILVRIYDVKGAKVLDQYIPSGVSKIDISSFSKGIYILRVYKGVEVYIQDKVIKN